VTFLNSIPGQRPSLARGAESLDASRLLSRFAFASFPLDLASEQAQAKRVGVRPSHSLALYNRVRRRSWSEPAVEAADRARHPTKNLHVSIGLYALTMTGVPAGASENNRRITSLATRIHPCDAA
jgi:hypothetical protein